MSPRLLGARTVVYPSPDVVTASVKDPTGAIGRFVFNPHFSPA